jgi:PKD repeat protein
MSFSVTSIAPSNVSSYDWDFGDGIGTDNIATPSYSYSSAGTFDVELIIESTFGCIDSVTKQVEITEPVDVSFICDSVCEGTASSFINTSVSPGSTVQYSWFFWRWSSISVSQSIAYLCGYWHICRRIGSGNWYFSCNLYKTYSRNRRYI